MATDRALYRRRRLLAAKLETTTGTAETVLATDAKLIVSNFGGIIPDDPQNDRELVGNRGYETSVPGGSTGSCDFEIDLSGNGASGLPPWATTLLPACDLIASGATYAYSTDDETVTLVEYEDGLKRILHGCKGDVTFTFSASGIGKARFRFIGCYTAETDATILAPTFPTVLPPACESMTMTIGGYSPRWSTLELALGNQLVMREDPTAATSYHAAAIPNCTPTMTLDPELVTVATKNWQSIREAATESALSIVLGGTANNILTFAATRLQVRSVRPGERNGLSIHALGFQLNGATPFSLAFS
jgi:hypothetical protein